MSRDFDRALEGCLRRIESGEDMERVLADYPAHAGQLREHLQVAAGLSRPPEVTGEARGRQRMLTVLASENELRGGISAMNGILSTGLRVVGGLAIAAVAVLAVAYFSGNLHVEVGDDAEAQATHPCLDQVLGNLADPPDGVFTIDDLIAARDAYETQNTDPRYDRDGDLDVDIFDLMVYIQELKDCFGV